MVPLDSPEHRDLSVTRENKELQVLSVTQEPQDLREPKDTKETREIKESKVQLEKPDQLVNLDLPDHQDLVDSVEKMDSLEPQESLVPLDFQVSSEHVELKEPKVSQEMPVLLDQKDCLVTRGLRENRELRD